MKQLRYIRDLIVRFSYWILSWFENHQYLYVSQHQYNSEGEVVDVIQRKFEVRKFYKKTPRHMKFKTMKGNIVELKTSTPVDYMTETMYGDR
jgi:hypothetical protein